ncbi:hypothetical protein [Phreatobacter stygius]|uniref:UrcA family protein n=1 Tax=Phreatobacter stygius TaxID=1940610 RepID=A0A4D7B802_9HYPH|nr:hypothetical protein [Phreatobacter stygius]QCI65756.1 hypothetical protein E8M01_16980 [Phreatobacter stygius]
MRCALPNRTLFLGLIAAGALAVAVPANANEICQSEFQPLLQSHQQVMQQTQAAMPRGRPTNFDQARANAQRACTALGNAQTSFERLKKWVTDNGDFCRLPDTMINDVSTGLTNVIRNRRQACQGVATLDRQRRQAEAGGANPFAPQAGRRPQLDLRTPGAL